MTSKLFAPREAAAPGLRSMSAILNDEQYTVVMLRFYFRFTQAEIASALNKSQPAISRLMTGAIDRLRGQKNLILDFPE